MSVAIALMRQEQGMTQAQFAAAIGVALPTVGRWESWDPPPRRGVKVARLIRYAESTNSSVAVMLKEYIYERDGAILPTTAQERVLLRGVLAMLRDPSPDWREKLTDKLCEVVALHEQSIALRYQIKNPPAKGDRRAIVRVS